MNLFPRYDRELVMALRPFLIDWNDLSATRARGKGMLISMSDAPSVAKEDRTIPGPPTAPAVPICIYRPVQSRGELPGLLWMHGMAGGWSLARSCRTISWRNTSLRRSVA
jgi:acetyl esterase/lipase